MKLQKSKRIGADSSLTIILEKTVTFCDCTFMQSLYFYVMRQIFCSSLLIFFSYSFFALTIIKIINSLHHHFYFNFLRSFILTHKDNHRPSTPWPSDEERRKIVIK